MATTKTIDDSLEQFMKKIQNLSAAGLEKFIKEYENDDKLFDATKLTCKNNWMSTDDYKNGNKSNMYKVCCEKMDLCTFYTQMWFYLACGGGAFLILIIVIIVVACCCCRKKGGGGGGGRGAGGLEDPEIREIE